MWFKGLSWAPLLQAERQGRGTIMELGVKQTQVQNWAPPLLGLCDLNFSFLIGQVKLLIPVSEDFPEDYKCVKKPPPPTAVHVRDSAPKLHRGLLIV